MSSLWGAIKTMLGLGSRNPPRSDAPPTQADGGASPTTADRIPFTPLHTRLKCIRNDGWDEVQRAAFQYAFPGFFEEARPNPDEVLRLNPLHQAANSREEPYRYRRFSGGAALPRGRYYSVCEADDGRDSQTLAQELMAYVRWGRTSGVFALDLDDPHQDGTWNDMAELWGVRCPAGQLAVIFQWDTPTPPPELGFLPRHKVRDGVRWFPVFYPTALTRPEFRRVIDLRQPFTQMWLTAAVLAGLPDVAYQMGDRLYRGLPLGDGSDRPWPADRPFVSRPGLDCYAYGPRPDWDGRLHRVSPSFWGLLPLLMFFGPGGSPLTEAVGRWVRSVGAEALVYPSARADVRCGIEYGVLKQSWGWDLVDYRGLAPPDERAMIIVEPHSWMGMFGQVHVNVPEARHGFTFFVDGNVEAHRRFVAPHMAEGRGDADGTEE